MSTENESFFKNTTTWGERFTIDKPLPEYPRPQLWRQSFINLNGVWSYAFRPEYSGIPSFYDDDIVVPFSPESALSGVLKTHEHNQALWYRKFFVLPINFIKDNVILHFGAVDQCCTVYINGIACADHEGGYLPFSVDITALLNGSENILELEVYDDTDKGGYCYGGQREKPSGGTYRAQSGIWQTVWLESVADNYIKSLKITPLYDESAVRFEIECNDAINTNIEISGNGKVVARGKCNANGIANIQLRNFISWSPEQPFLYDVTISNPSDSIESYFAMRKISYIKDVQGRVRFALNNKHYLVTGVQSACHWPDGLYTPASDQAFTDDIMLAQRMGFNAIRLSQKIEAMRFYYHCDRIGMLVWQDIPQGGKHGKKLYTKTLPKLGFKKISDLKPARFGRRSRDSRTNFIEQLEQTVQTLYNSPCVVAYSLFDEGKGQFESITLCEKIWQLDGQRLVDHASGWHDQGGGDVKSRHCFGRILVKPDGRVLGLTAFGGYSLALKDYMVVKQATGFKTVRNEDALVKKIEDVYQNEILPLLKNGLSVLFYTQLTDIRDLANGLATYNRKWIKIEETVLKRLNTHAKACFEAAVLAPKHRYRQN